MKTSISWVLRIIVAVILFQTLFFKFSGAEESKFIFATLGVEPWGRWFAGFSELVAGIMILVPATHVFGAAFSLMIMSGAIMSHFVFLGIEVQGDGGLLFGLACVVFLAASGVLWISKGDIQRMLKGLRGQ